MDEVQAKDKKPIGEWKFTNDEGVSNYQDSSTKPTEPFEPISWAISESIFQEKSFFWYATLVGGTLIFTALVYLLTKDKITALVIILSAAVLAFYASRRPHEVEYRMDEVGLTVGGRQFDYSGFKSFSVSEEVNATLIVLLPLKRFMPALSVYCKQEDQAKILAKLADHMPIENHHEDIVDRFMRKIRY